MCQLLGMNCNVPTDICFSFAGFRQRGGGTDHHSDGWGIAFFEGKGVRSFLDPTPSAHSQIAELVRSYPIKSLNVIAHIRKSTLGPTSLENTHPFVREMWGRYWVFAHNGHLPQFKPALNGSFTPVGHTDSELVFCWVMQEMKRRLGVEAPSRDVLFAVLHKLTLELAPTGIFNFLLSNGACLFAHCSTELAYVVRRAPFAQAHLTDEDVTVDFAEVTTPHDRVAVIATQPLTDNECWEIMPPGTLWQFHEGEPVAHRKTAPSPYKSMAEAGLAR
jgi:predicted glutamine amidotransferase